MLGCLLFVRVARGELITAVVRLAKWGRDAGISGTERFARIQKGAIVDKLTVLVANWLSAWKNEARHSELQRLEQSVVEGVLRRQPTGGVGFVFCL